MFARSGLVGPCWLILHRFLNAVGRREQEALFELWHEKNLDHARSQHAGKDSPLCCAAPDWETALVELDRLGAAAVDLEHCRACGAWRLTTNWPKDSSGRAAMEAARVSAEDAAALKAANWEERRRLLDSKGWHGLNG